MFGTLSPTVKNLLSNANTWTKLQTVELFSLGSVTREGISLVNKTNATSAVSQQVSPATIWEAKGWNTATATSNAQSFRAYVVPTPGNPTSSSWFLQHSLNNAAYTNALRWDSRGAASTHPLFTMTGFAKVASNNSSTVDTLATLDVNSSGNRNHIVHTYGTTVRSAWSSDSNGYTEWKTAGSNPVHTFYVGNSISSQTLIAQIYTSGFYNSYNNFNQGKVTSGSADQTVQTTLSTYGSFAVKGKLVIDSSYTLAETETFVYVDPSNAEVCTGTPPACSTYATESPCNARSAVGCSWYAGDSCGGATGTDSGTCTGQGAGCTWEQASCSGANNTDQSTCEAQDDSYGGSCVWDESTCGSQGDEGSCNAIPGCTWNSSDCNTYNGTDQSSCENNSGCTWFDDGGNCSSYGDENDCSNAGCFWNGSSCVGLCSGVYDTSCSGSLCTGDYDTGNCLGTYGALCQGTANCGNLTDDGSTACNAESGCTWTVGITLTLPTTANANRNGTGRVYSIMHVGSRGNVILQGQSGEPIFQFTTLPLFKKGDKVLLHNQNITYQCSIFSSSTPCNAQTGCTWVNCPSYGDESSCNAVSGCGWDGEFGNCTGTENTCVGTYDNGFRWYAHSLERGLNYVEKTATYTLLDIDDVVNCTSGTFTLNLPSAALNNGKTYHLKNTGAGTITVDPFSTETIDGLSTDTIASGGSMTIVSNNSNWIKI